MLETIIGLVIFAAIVVGVIKFAESRKSKKGTGPNISPTRPGRTQPK